MVLSDLAGGWALLRYISPGQLPGNAGLGKAGLGNAGLGNAGLGKVGLG